MTAILVFALLYVVTVVPLGVLVVRGLVDARRRRRREAAALDHLEIRVGILIADRDFWMNRALNLENMLGRPVPLARPGDLVMRLDGTRETLLPPAPVLIHDDEGDDRR